MHRAQVKRFVVGFSAATAFVVTPVLAAPLRWTAATPDAMVDLAVARALGDKNGESADGAEVLASLATLSALAPRAAAGLVVEKLRMIAREARDREGAAQAAWIAASLTADPASAAPAGLVTSLAVLGPFPDAGGRLAAADLPETNPAAWGDERASYAWGIYDVRWRRVLAGTTARGVPLDLYLHPRKESCAYVASRITLPATGPLVVHLASSGSVRLLWDGQTLGQSDDVHEGALFDRLGARVEGTAGDHLLAAKVCAGPLDDVGRVRFRMEGPSGNVLPFASSSDLGPLRSAGFRPAAFLPGREALAAALESKKSLASAIIRLQGGADDLRSPRAPGLLEGIARDPGTTADALAMVGWVAPFGAQRSGWLNAARERAVATKDRETLHFALRRMAAARVEAGFGDWAMAALRARPLVDARDPEAALLRAVAQAAVGGDGARRASLGELMALATAQGGRASSGLWDQVARSAHGFDPRTEARALDEVARRSPERFDLSRIQAARFVGGAAVAEAARAMLRSGSLVDADDIDDVAQQLVQSGRPVEARELLLLGGQLAPNRADVQASLAEALFASRQTADQAPARLALLRARALDPGDAKKRAEAALRAKGQQEDRSRDERWLVEPGVFLTRGRATAANRKEIADRQLHWLRAVTLHEDQRISQLIHYAREVVIAPRTQEELYEQLPFEGEETELLRARVHRANGDVAFAEEQKSDQGRPMIRWPELKSGDVVEVALRSWTAGPVGRRGDPPFYFLDYAGSVSTHPLLYNEVVIDSPKAKPLAIDVLHGRPDRLIRTEEASREVTHYIWDRPVHFPDEPFAPKPSEVYPTIVGSTFATWAQFRTWYQAAVQGFTEPDEQVRRLAAELTRGKRTREEKLKAIFEFVSDDIRYVNYVSGEWWLPNRPQQLLARRQGDCDDKAILLITLLRAVGIEATEVLIQTRYTAQPSVLRSTKAAIPLFDHGIALLPAQGQNAALWLDATSPQSRLGPIPSMDLRAFALFANDGPPVVVPTPVGEANDYGFEAQWNFQMEADGAARLEAEEVHHGDQAFALRSNLRERDARAPWVEQNLIAGWIPQVQVDKDVDFAADLPRGDARVRYRAKSQGFGRREGADLVVTLAPLTTLTSHYAPLPVRTLPVVLPPSLAPGRQMQRVRLVAPEGMNVGDLPPGGEENGGDFGLAKLEVKRDPAHPNVALVTRTVTFQLDVIPVARYGAWRAWLSRLDSLMHQAIRFVPAKRIGGNPNPLRLPQES